MSHIEYRKNISTKGFLSQNWINIFFFKPTSTSLLRYFSIFFVDKLYDVKLFKSRRAATALQVLQAVSVSSTYSRVQPNLFSAQCRKIFATLFSGKHILFYFQISVPWRDGPKLRFYMTSQVYLILVALGSYKTGSFVMDS